MKPITFTWNKRRHSISESLNPLIIAEVGVNHNGKIKLAKKLIDLAKSCGADIVKFQSFITEEITTPTSKTASYIKRNVKEQKWHNVLKKLELSQKDQKELFNYCKRKNIVFLSTPYDYKSADFLDELGTPMFKIASTDTNNIPFIEHVAKKGKPMIISTGMSAFDEVKEALKACRQVGNDQVILMQCTTNYPATIEAANIRVISTYRDKLRVLVGYSDHTNSDLCAILAVGQGAALFEKHFTINKKLPGPDQSASAGPKEMERYIDSIRQAARALGDGIKRVENEEKDTKPRMQKSLTSTRNIKIGELITKEDVLIRRPATGIAPKYLNTVIGKIATRDIKQDMPIREADVKW